MKVSPSRLVYLVDEQPNNRFSFSLEESDFSPNQNLLDHIVGTLVKYGPSGHLEPYLAEKWSISQDRKTWKFQLRSVSCDDGQPITAQYFVAQLTQRFSGSFSGLHSLDFDLLEGWDKFRSEPSSGIDGLYASGNHLVLKFRSPPGNLLEALRKVAFGYWCNGSSGSPNDLPISSGAYKIDNVSDDGTVVKLNQRPGWFSNSPGSPKEIVFTSGPLPQTAETPTILAVGSVPKIDVPEDYIQIQSVPDQLIALSVHPRSGSLLGNPSNRKYFKFRILEFIKSHLNAYPDLTLAKSFFPGKSRVASSPFSGAPAEYVSENRILDISVSSKLRPEIESLIRDALLNALPSGQQFDFKLIDRSQPNWAKDFMSARDMDIRVPTVGVGEFGNNDAIKMMFCSTLGVSFPDPNGRVCGLVREYESKEIPPDDDYFERFHKALDEDSQVIPIFHTGKYYLYPKSIDPSSICPQLTVPRFDLIRFK